MQYSVVNYNHAVHYIPMTYFSYNWKSVFKPLQAFQPLHPSPQATTNLFSVSMSLILNAISPLLPSYWGFSFAFGSGIPFWWEPTFSCRCVQQRVVILEFLQEKMSTRLFTLPSCICIFHTYVLFSASYI